MNSPRSIEVLGRLGYELEDLMFIDFSTYKNNQTNYVNLSEEGLRSRYEFFENHKKEKIAECLKVSNKINKINKIN